MIGIGMVEIELSEGLINKIKIVLGNAGNFEHKLINGDLNDSYRASPLKIIPIVKGQPYGINSLGIKNNKYYLLKDIMIMAKTGGKVMLSPEGVRIINEVQALPNNEVYGMEY